MDFGGDHSAPGHGKIVPRCVPKPPAVARYRPDAFPKGPRTGKAPVRGNISPPCIQIQLIWQDMRGMYPKSPAKRRWGTHRASILPPRGVFAVRGPQIMHGARILPPSDGLGPAQGLLPEQLHHGIAFKRLGPCAGTTSHAGRGSWTLLNAWPMCRDDPSAPPMPATCQCLPPAVPIAARDKPPMDFGGGYPAHGLQSGQAPRDRRLRHLDGRANNGMLRRAGPGLQNREQVGAEPPAEAAGPACVSAAENAHRKDESLLTEL